MPRKGNQYRCKVCNRMAGKDGYCKACRERKIAAEEEIKRKEYSCPLCEDKGFGSADMKCNACRWPRKVEFCSYCQNEGFGSFDNMCSRCRPDIPGREQTRYLMKDSPYSDYGEGFQHDQPAVLEVKDKVDLIKDRYDIERGFDGN